ncbi:MAG TPA: hypothetical protein VGE45_00260 [Chloroflexia bacterium]|jgi:hypothetical protein
MEVVKRTWLRVVVWAVVLGGIASLVADWGEWDRIALNFLWRVLIAAVGGVAGLVMNYFAGNYVGMGTNVVESMGIVKFSSDTPRKIENSFIFVGALVGAIIGMIFII